MEKVEVKQQVHFDDIESDHINELRKNKTIWLGENHLSFKKRLYQFIATLVTTLIVNFSTKKKWQLGLVLYLLIVCPIGTKVFISWFINLFF